MSTTPGQIASTIDTHSVATHRRVSRLLTKSLLHLLLLLIGFIMLVPFLWMISSVFKENSQLFAVPPQWIPNPFVWSNLASAWQQINFVLGYENSLKIAISVVVLQLFTASLSAYAFARLKFRFKNFVFMLFMATMMVPGQVTVIAKFVLFKHLGLLNSPLALILPGALSAPFAIFLIRQFIMTIPTEIDESAFMDGAGHFTIYLRIIMPMCRPALATLAIFTFLGSWNDFFNALIFLNNPSKYTLPLLLAMTQGQYTSNFSILLSGASIAIIPIIVVFIFFQRYIIESITISGLK